jgi:hypothetical protein
MSIIRKLYLEAQKNTHNCVSHLLLL